jgi:hypothetical protein
MTEISRETTEVSRETNQIVSERDSHIFHRLAFIRYILQTWLASLEVHQLDLGTDWWILRTESRQVFSINYSPNLMERVLMEHPKFSLNNQEPNLLVISPT